MEIQTGGGTAYLPSSDGEEGEAEDMRTEDGGLAGCRRDNEEKTKEQEKTEMKVESGVCEGDRSRVGMIGCRTAQTLAGISSRLRGHQPEVRYDEQAGSGLGQETRPRDDAFLTTLLLYHQARQSTVHRGHPASFRPPLWLANVSQPGAAGPGTPRTPCNPSHQ